MKNYLVVNFKNGQRIVFDEYCDDREENIEYQTFSVRICKDHLKQCRNLLEEVGCTIDENGSGCCSVKGCSATWEDEDEIFYVYIPIESAIETDECETIESVDEVPNLKISKINIKSETFCTPWNGKMYCVDICEDAEERGAWLYNASYGIKSFMFGTSVEQDSRDEFLDMVFSNLPDYIEGYAEEYED